MPRATTCQSGSANSTLLGLGLVIRQDPPFETANPESAGDLTGALRRQRHEAEDQAEQADERFLQA